MFWGDRVFTLKDPDGHVWTFATMVGSFDPDKMPTPQEMAQPPLPPREHQSMIVKNLPDLRVLFDRHIGAYCPENLSPFFAQFMGKAAQHQLFSSQSMVLGICQDDPRDTPEEDCRYDAGITVAVDVPCPEGLMEQVLPGGDYAVILHKGPYDNLQDTWQWIGEIAFPNLNRECRDQPPFECYLNSPADTAPDELLTEIYIPLD
jgi:AraC family transcriptional regulator